MYARFFFALALALTITGISVLGQAKTQPRSVVCCSPAAVGAMAAITAAPRHATLLPTITVRPSASDRLALRNSSIVPGMTTLATVNLDGAREMLSGRVRERVSRVSLMVPYYAFGGPRTRATE